MQYDGDIEDVLSSTSPPLNTWTHVAAVFNGSHIKLYINGVLDDVELIDGSIVTDSSDLGICSVNNGASNYFQGSIDELSILLSEMFTIPFVFSNSNAPLYLPEDVGYASLYAVPSQLYML